LVAANPSYRIEAEAAARLEPGGASATDEMQRWAQAGHRVSASRAGGSQDSDGGDS
jgi:hypothetical protein